MLKGELQKVFDEALRDMPRVFLEGMIEKKLVEADIEPTSKLIGNLAEAAMAGENHKIDLDDEGNGPDIVITFTDEDVKEFENSMRKFLKDDLPKIVVDVSLQTARSVVRALKKNWPEQNAWEQQIQSEFRDRLADRWGEALDFLGMLLTSSRELGEEKHRKRQRSRAKRNLHRIDVLLRLHARACQVTGEIMTLMEAGYADGAMARWRTLHEICTVATLIAEHDDELAERYMAHDVVESKRALEVFMRTYKDLGCRPPAKRDARRTENLYHSVLATYGTNFGSQYGWVAKHLRLKKPNFSDLEKAAQRSQMRSHYKMACHNVHAGIKGITDQLGVLPDSPVILAGASNVGLDEPGQNAAITLTQVTFTLIEPRSKFDDVVMLRVLADLQNKAAKAFVRAGRQLEREEAKRQQAAK